MPALTRASRLSSPYGGSSRTGRPGFLNRTLFADELGRDALEHQSSSRRRRGLCANDGYALKRRSVEPTHAVVVCPKCGEVSVVPKSSNVYRLASTVMEPEP